MFKVIDVVDDDYRKIEKVIYQEGLSYYEIKKEDFICYKYNDKIISFGRIFNIGGKDYELSCLWVDEKYRGNKMGVDIINDLINNKFNKSNNLFLACKKEIQDYYKKVNFEMINENIPEKLEGTLRWGKENNFDAIIMKYNG